MEVIAERKHKEYLYRQVQYKELIRQENEKMARYLVRFGKTK
jgi:hypothetical protein